MAHTLTEAATFDATVTVPDDGDALNVNSVNGAFQSLADRTKFLNQHMQAGASETRMMLMVAGYNTGFVQGTTGAFGETSANGASDILEIPLDLPHGQSLTAVSVYVKGAVNAAHGGGTPGVLPTLSVYSYDVTTGTQAQIGGTFTDPFTSKAVYEAVHTLDVTGLAHSVDRTKYHYLAKITGEGGANSAALFAVFGAVATWTRTTWGND